MPNRREEDQDPFTPEEAERLRRRPTRFYKGPGWQTLVNTYRDALEQGKMVQCPDCWRPHNDDRRKERFNRCFNCFMILTNPGAVARFWAEIDRGRGREQPAPVLTPLQPLGSTEREKAKVAAKAKVQTLFTS